MLQSDFDEDIAKLVILKLDAGKYEITEWYTSYAKQYGTYETRSKQGFPIYFDVTTDTVTYIGEENQDNEYSGFSIVDSKVNITDSGEGDLSLFLQKFSNIRKEQTVEKLAYKGTDK